MPRFNYLKQFSILPWVKSRLSSLQGKTVLLGLTVGLWYLPSWLVGLLDRGPQSTSGLTLATYFLGLASYCLWKQRKQLILLEASEEDRLLGCILIICGVTLFPFCRFAIWPQALLWLLILVGIATCSWGLRFFKEHQLLVISTLVTVYPRPAETARLLWQALTPHKYLEGLMAQAGAWGLQILGWQASAVKSLVTFPEGAVDVYWGCNGFDMALTMVIAGSAMGLFLNQNRRQTLVFILIGVVAALIFNVPRIMLMAVASVYWGEDWFNFWHGTWGGQIFSTMLLTVYYYCVIGIAQKSKLKSQSLPSNYQDIT